MTEKCCILLVCGLPSSGKTTLTRKLVQRSAICCVQKRNRDYCRNCLISDEIKFYWLSVDDLMSINDQSNAVKQTNGVWKLFRRNLLMAAKCFISDLRDNSHHRTEIRDNNEITRIYESIKKLNNYDDCGATKHRLVVVVIDDNLYYRSMRYEWYKLAKQFGTGFAQIIVECPLDLAMVRNSGKSDEQRVPNDVIIKMNERFEMSQMNGFELRTLYVSYNCEISDDITQLIEDAIRNPVDHQTTDCDEEKRNESKLANNSNIIHKVDCVLREIISEIIDSSTNKIATSKVLIDAKKLVLNQLRESQDCLPLCIQNELISSTYISENVKIFFKNLLNKNVISLQTFRQ